MRFVQNIKMRKLKATDENKVCEMNTDSDRDTEQLQTQQATVDSEHQTNCADER